MELVLKTAKVLNIDDEDKTGKIQIQVFPEMSNLKDTSSCPWAIPFLSDNTSGESETFSMSNNLPEVNSTIWVLVDVKTWKRFYYVSKRYFETCFDFTKCTDAIESISNNNSISELDETYANLRFNLLSNGTLMWHNVDDCSCGIIQNKIADNPSYIIFDKEGNLNIESGKDLNISVDGDEIKKVAGDETITYDGSYSLNASDDISIQSDKSITLSSTSSSKATIGNSVGTLALLSDIIDEINSTIDNICNMQTYGSPALHTVMPTTITNLTLNKTNLTTLQTKWNNIFD